MRTKHLLTASAIVGAAALLVGCASGQGDQATDPALTIQPETASTTSSDDGQSPSPDQTDGAGTGAATLPAPIVSIEYELDDTPGNDDDDDDRTTTDPGHIAALTELLERHGVVRDYDRDDDCDDEEWELDLDAHLEGGETIDIDIETCSPDAFETELIELVQTWY